MRYWAHYPGRETKIAFHSNDNVEVGAVLVPLAVEPDDLDGVASDVPKMPGVRHATRTVSAL